MTSGVVQNHSRLVLVAMLVSFYKSLPGRATIFATTVLLALSIMLPSIAWSQAVRTPVLVRVIDATNDDPLNLRRIRHELDSHVVPKATGIKMAVAEIKKLVKQDECIDQLVFHGHGRPGVLSMGKGSTRKPGLTGDEVIDGSDFKPPHNTKLLKDLASLLCKGAEASRGQIDITLRGCCVGAWKEGAEKLFAIAQLFAGHKPKVCVTAPTGYIRTDVIPTEAIGGGWEYWWLDLELLGTRWQVAYSTDTSPPTTLPRVWPSTWGHIARHVRESRKGDPISADWAGQSGGKLTPEQVNKVWP